MNHVPLHPESLSPDPTYGRPQQPQADGWNRYRLWPARSWQNGAWQTGERWRAGEPQRIGAGGSRRDVLVDFGCELEAELVLRLRLHGICTCFVTLGESEPEARGEGAYGQGAWMQVRDFFIDRPGEHEIRVPTWGFRFARLQFHDLAHEDLLLDCHADAVFVGTGQQGDFRCPDDPVLQRLWQTSLYTARLCTRPDDLWDGIKRDRLGWYGDARVTQLALDCGYLMAAPALAMLARLPLDDWVNGIPNFSFDAVMMLRDLVLAHGCDLPDLAARLQQVDSFLDWVAATQLDAQGLVQRSDRKLQFGFGFLDWSALPVGGRLEEQGCLQMKYCEALRAAAVLHGWCGTAARADAYAQQAARLAQVIRQGFSCAGGFHHTLRRIRSGFEKYAPGWAEPSYAADGPDLGPSGASRHSSACAVFAGLVDDDRAHEVLEQGFDATGQPAIITPMFLYYEQEARARLGAAGDALTRMRDWLADMVLPNDASTIWESFEPERRDFRKWALNNWPKSLCHGWGAGLVPLTQRWLLGLENRAPGWRRVRVHEPALPLAFSARIPTPQGIISIERPREDGPVAVELPAGIEEEPQ